MSPDASSCVRLLECGECCHLLVRCERRFLLGLVSVRHVGVTGAAGVDFAYVHLYVALLLSRISLKEITKTATCKDPYWMPYTEQK